MKQTVVLKKVEHPSMATAIRQHCLACSGGQQIEVRRCGITNCPLFPYRFGANPRSAATRLGKYYTLKFI